MAKTAAEMVAEAKGRIENLSVDQVAAERARGEALLVDLRESEERASQGSIPGAVHVPRGVLEFSADPGNPSRPAGMDPERRVILHCAGGGRSALAVETLQQMGYQNVAHLDGGFGAWQAAGQAVEDGSGGAEGRR